MIGYVHIYTGNGKGKTCAAIGLAIRALGAGWKVYLGQFLKSGQYSEHLALARFSDLLTIETFGKPGFIQGEPSDRDRHQAQAALGQVTKALTSGTYRLVILDEANVAAHLGLVRVEQLIELVDLRPQQVELVFTGRHAHPALIARADLVTEMQEVKHYFQQGVAARTGVEK
ncbi:MAG: cob(I)yrinic acid a,c-diamide adenosyltransferase [Deltaproteobacteria bacterium]|nr:cob(I)yrinic acid a,c-diamide adenosyltransferase [Deltaproteobacteria bacterium]MBW2071538.1 cob(I)yrinic acid a,c-diamide adenosyltransferase [Deltaproteobacteria bacterium]